MTKNVLVQYTDLKREIKDLKRRANEYQKQLDVMEESGYSVKDTVFGGEGGIQPFKIEGFPFEEYSRKKSVMQGKILRYNQKVKELEDLLCELEEFIDSIPDSRDRQILRFFFIDGMSQQKVALKMYVDQSTVSLIIKKHCS